MWTVRPIGEGGSVSQVENSRLLGVRPDHGSEVCEVDVNRPRSTDAVEEDDAHGLISISPVLPHTGDHQHDEVTASAASETDNARRPSDEQQGRNARQERRTARRARKSSCRGGLPDHRPSSHAGLQQFWRNRRMTSCIPRTVLSWQNTETEDLFQNPALVERMLGLCRQCTYLFACVLGRGLRDI